MNSRLLYPFVLRGVILGLCASVFAQAPSSLVVKRAASVRNEKAEDFVLPVTADTVGNIYLRYSDGWKRPDAVSKISRAGKKVLSFGLSGVPGLSEAEIGSFCVSGDKLFLLARRRVGPSEIAYIVAFGLDGAFLSSVRIDGDLEADQISPLPSDRFILVGRGRGAPGAGDSTPQTAIISSEGKMVESIRLEGDVTPIEREKRTAANGAVRRDKDFEMSLAASTIETADDRNVYLMRYGKNGLVFVISPNGGVIHRFALESPSDSSLKEIKVARHKLAALFVRWKQQTDMEADASFVRVYDAESGKLLSSYVLDPSIPNLLAAYDGDMGFTFVGPEVTDAHHQAPEDVGRLRIFEVGPR